MRMCSLLCECDIHHIQQGERSGQTVNAAVYIV